MFFQFNGICVVKDGALVMTAISKQQICTIPIELSFNYKIL
jgi:hypothetical protein